MTRITEEVTGTDETPEQVEDDLPEELEAEPETDAEEAESEAPAGEQGEAETAELSITLGDEPEPEAEDRRQAPEWVKNLREENRKLVRRQRELEQQLAKNEPAKAVATIGPRPKLSDPDIDYDEDKLAARLDVWIAQKAEVDDQERQKKRVAEEAEQKWHSRLSAVNGVTKAMKVPDLDEAIERFEETFSVVQRGLILDAPEDPKVSAQLRYALGRNPKVAKELAAEVNPVKFTFKLAELVGKMKVSPKKSAPTPERVVRSTVAGAAAVDNQLERLRAEADKTGDRTKVAAYMRQQKHKQAA
jgi:hypothetical protein